MNYLSIDTSTRSLSLAVTTENQVLSFMNEPMTKKLNTEILPGIEAQLEKNSLTLDDIDAILIGRGPGAFTSLRVGMSTAKGICFAKKISIMGVSSLAAIAHNVQGSCENLCVIVDAKRNLIYSVLYAKTGSDLTIKKDYDLSSMDELIKLLPAGTKFIGDGVPLYREAILKAGHTVVDNEEAYLPQAKHFALIAAARLKDQDYDDLDSLEPLYLYPEDCQVHKA